MATTKLPSSPARAARRRRRSIPAVTLAFSLLATAGATAGEAVTVDTERREVRIPCRFVRASRDIEVFACHTSGPAHETVLTFDATGPQLFDALKKIGCRPIDHWNATSPDHFFRNQGDRVLVLVRWTWNGKTHELPAEALLLDGITQSPSFLRGFSFGARDVSAASSPRPQKRDDAAPSTEPAATPRIPDVVEITLGAQQRQRAVYSLLIHPTALDGQKSLPQSRPCRSLQSWTFMPVVHVDLFEDLDRLVEKAPEATLIFRRLESEADLIQYSREIAARRGVGNRLSLYDRLEPLAQEIDRLKAAYETLTRPLRDDSFFAVDFSEFYGDLRPEFGARAEMVKHFADWLSERLQELYFKTYVEQESFRLAQLRLEKTTEPYVLEIAKTLVEDGLHFEAAIATRERQAAESRLGEFLRREEVAALELERNRRIDEANLRQVNARIDELDPDAEYVRQLHEEEKRRYEISIRGLEARRRLVESRVHESRAFLDGSWKPELPVIRRTRAIAEQILRVCKLEHDLNEVAQNLRWEHNDLESDLPERRDRARGKIAELTARQEELERGRQTERRKLAELEQGT